jgi:hypothetical protein
MYHPSLHRGNASTARFSLRRLFESTMNVANLPHQSRPLRDLDPHQTPIRHRHRPAARSATACAHLYASKPCIHHTEPPRTPRLMIVVSRRTHSTRSRHPRGMSRRLRRDLRDRVCRRHCLIIRTIIISLTITSMSRTAPRHTIANSRHWQSIHVLARPLASPTPNARLPHTPAIRIHRRAVPLFSHVFVVEVVVRSLSGSVAGT